MKKEYEFYEKIKDWDFDKFQIKSESLTDWDIYEILRSITDENSKVLDLGTGGGEKVLKEFPQCEILATDYSKEMIKTANKNLEVSGRGNITFRIMDNLNMDVEDSTFDVVVARNTVTDPKQIYKALKTGGYLLITGVDQYDCYELKRIFGKGQGFNDEKPISIVDYENVLDAGFKDVELVPIHEKEYFKNKDIFKAFLLKVPIIEDFSEEQKYLEDEKLDLYISRNTYPQGIKLTRRYYGITARK